MQTLESLLKKGTTILKDNGLEEAGLDAWLLLEYKTGKNRAYYFAHGDEPVSDVIPDLQTAPFAFQIFFIFIMCNIRAVSFFRCQI